MPYLKNEGQMTKTAKRIVKKHYAELGSVSSGTMRPEDLIPEFAYTLKSLAPKSRRDHQKLIRKANAIEDYDSEDAGYILDELFIALEEYAAPYCYFGANEGDGADYGFWTALDSLEEDARHGEVLKVADTADVPREFRGYIMLVSDHGNVTLLEKTGKRGQVREIWSIV